MKRSVRRLRIIAASVAILLLAVAAAVWVGAVEHWIGQELRTLAAARLNPTFTFDDLRYAFPRTVILRGIRLTSPDPEVPGEPIGILAMDSLTLVLSDIPRPNRPFRMQQLDLVGLTLRLVRIRAGEASGSLLGFSNLLKHEPEPAAPPAPPPAKPSDAGVYGIDFSLDHHPVLDLALRGRLLADDQRLEVDTLSSTLQLAREQDHFLTPPMQKLLAARDITGRLTLEATGMLAFDDPASSHLQAHLELSDAGYAAGDYALALDHVGARISAAEGTVTIDEALDRTADAAMKREHTGHDELSLEFSFDGDRARIRRLRMNSRWYGLRGHGDIYFDSRLDLAVDGGPVQRVENEVGAVGDVLGELTETLLRAHVTGNLGDPKVRIEVLRQPLR